MSLVVRNHFWKNVDPEARRLNFIHRFWSKVERTDTCWLWLGTVSKKNGYAKFQVYRAGALAHRVAYEIANGPIPEHREVMQTCNNRLCVNPAHLKLRTRAERELRKTHCVHGHEFTQANTRYTGTGARLCRTCKREWERTHPRDRRKVGV